MMDIQIFDLGGVRVINSTPHPCTFLVLDDVVMVAPSGILLNAKVQEDTVEVRKLPNGICEPPYCECGRCGDEVRFVAPRFVPDQAGLEFLDSFEKEYPGVLVLGSVIAAQAYPGRVVAMAPAKGYERVPTAEKRMDSRKFSVFS